MKARIFGLVFLVLFCCTIVAAQSRPRSTRIIIGTSWPYPAVEVGDEWVDTSVSPAESRQCLNAGVWSTLAVLSPDGSSSNSITASSQSVQITMSQYRGVGVTVTGTWVGALAPEVSFDGGSTWKATQLYDISANKYEPFLTANGSYSFLIAGGVSHVRLRSSAWTSGTATVAIRATEAEFKVVSQAPSQPFLFQNAVTEPAAGNIMNVGGMSVVTVYVEAEGNGTVQFQVSGDGNTFTPFHCTDDAGVSSTDASFSSAFAGYFSCNVSAWRYMQVQVLSLTGIGRTLTATGWSSAFGNSWGTFVHNNSNEPLSVEILTGGAIIGSLAANQSVNINQIGGSAVSTAASGVQRVGIVGNAGATVDSTIGAATAPTNQVVTGGVYNSTKPTLTNGQAAAVQLDTKGNQLGVVRDAAGNDRGANVDATNRLSVSVDNSNVSSNIAQINGVTPLMGNGTTGTGSQRVTIASDNTANSNPWLAQPVPGTANGASTCVLQSAASTNATNCKASAGLLYGVEVINTTSTIYYLRMYNLSSSPTCSSSTGFIRTIPIPHGSGVGAGIANFYTVGETYGTGIGFCFTGGGSSTDNTNAATGVYITLHYK